MLHAKWHSGRAFREALDGEQFTDRLEAERTIARVVRWYNTERLHRALGYLRPIDYCGDPVDVQENRRRKLAAARHRRKEANLQLRQRSLLLEA